MHAFAGYVMRSPFHAVAVATLLAVLSLYPVLGILSMFSGAVIALVTLRRGAKPGLMVLLGASLATSLAVYFTHQNAALGWVYAVLLWLPLWGLAHVLRTTVSWKSALDTAGALGLIAVSLAYFSVPDPAQLWQTVLTSLVDTIEAQGGGAELSALRDQIPAIARWMTGFLAAVLVLGWVASLLIARWWQSLLYHPGGFRQEFLGLRQSKMMAMVVVGFWLLALIAPGKIGQIAKSVMIIAMVLYSLIGLALVHAGVAATGKHVGWLVVLYVLLLIVPPYVMMVLAMLGMVDGWADFRARWQSAGKGGPSRGDGNGQG